MATTTSYSTIFGDWAWIFLTYPEFYGIKIICLENSWRSIVKKVTEIELKHPSGCHQIFGCANSIAWCFSWYWPNRSPCVHLLVVLMWTHVGPGERWRSIKVARWRIFDGFLTDLSFNRSRVSRNMEPHWTLFWDIWIWALKTQIYFILSLSSHSIDSGMNSSNLVISCF